VRARTVPLALLRDGKSRPRDDHDDAAKDRADYDALSPVHVRRLAADELAEHLDGLADVLEDCVAGGASVSYMWPFSHEQARAAFEEFAADAADGRRLILAAFDGDRLVGTVQVNLALPPNQPHRARSRSSSSTGRRADAASRGGSWSRRKWRRAPRARRCSSSTPSPAARGAPLRPPRLDEDRRRPELRALPRRPTVRRDDLLEEARVNELDELLLAWFADHGADLPWRRTRDPYAILVSEVMLQQTQVAASSRAIARGSSAGRPSTRSPRPRRPT
jgi:hypothetical protein